MPIVKVFALDKDGKINLTKEQLQKLLDESYWAGYNANNHYVYHSPTLIDPYNPWNPYYQVTCSNDTATIKTNSLTTDTHT